MLLRPSVKLSSSAALLHRIVKRILRVDDHCVDVGAHRGQMLKLFEKYAPDGIHYAIEPVPDLMQQLKKQFKGKNNIRFVEKAVADVNDHLDFMYVINKPALSGIIERELPRRARSISILVECVTLDDFLPSDYRMNALKIDVCGAEQQVLMGARKRIMRDRPNIFFRHYHKELSCYNARPEDTYQLLREELRMRIYTPRDFLSGKEALSSERFVSIFHRADDKYFIALPEEKNFRSATDGLANG